jgi:hypothetical protein
MPSSGPIMLTRRRFMNAITVSAASLLLAGCWGDGRVVKRIKVIAKAEVDGKPVEGSSVVELQWRPRGDGGMDSDGQGEAVILELPGHGTLYVLEFIVAQDGRSTSGFWNSQVQEAAGISGGVNKADLPKIAALQGRFPFLDVGEGESLLPVIVAFKDETDFRSVYRVSPEEFSKHFGAGVKFLGVEFEVTDEPVTEVLAKRLPVLLEKDRAVADPEIMKKAFVDWPFNYKVGQNTFFSKRRF